MSFAMLVRTAFNALIRNLSRSLLTMLGIIIGVGAVIASMAIGAGAKALVDKQIESLGANLIVIMPGSVTAGGVRLGAGAQTTLRQDDVDSIEANVPGVAAVAPVSQTSGQVVAGGTNWSTTIAGSTPDYFSIGNWRLAQGTFFTDADVAGVAKVAVLGKSVDVNLFPSGGAVGAVIIVKNVPFRVLGVLVAKGQQGPRDQDDVVIVPISTHQERLTGQTWINTIQVSAESADGVAGVVGTLGRLLRLTHHLAPTTPDDFTIRNVADVQQVREATANTQALLLAAVAVVSLLVGGIGIMNIMLVSVTERTREIGLRLAVGARKRDILWQFIIEALIMACAGGLIGVASGLTISFLVSSLAGWPTLVSGFSIVLGFLSAAFTGVVFGFYPARRAASLMPIDALRYE